MPKPEAFGHEFTILGWMGFSDMVSEIWGHHTSFLNIAAFED